MLRTGSREDMSRERKGRIVAEARVAELQRFIDEDAEADRKREAELARLQAEAEADAREDAKREQEAKEVTAHALLTYAHKAKQK